MCLLVLPRELRLFARKSERLCIALFAVAPNARIALLDCHIA